MGSVFLAREPELKRLVAVKVLSPALAVDPGARARFAREAQAVAQLSHPNIVAIYSVGQLADATPYFVMQHVGGRSMSERIEQDGPLGSEEAEQVLGEVASALAAAHERGIVHRDIKPANILYDDESGRVLVSDFGIAAVRPRGDQQGVTRLTQTGMAVGTPHYMSPEQLLAEDVTEKTDVYGLGLFGYEMIAGTGPFAATSPQELVAAHLRDTPKPLSEVGDHVDPELEGAVAACLSKQAGDRPTAKEIAQRFNPAAGVLLEWPAPGLASVHGSLKPVTRLLAIGNAFVAAGLVVLFSFGPTLASALTSALTVIIWVLGTIGIVAVIAGCVKLIRLSGAVARAVRAGYGWWSVAETVADRRRDTGALIAGMREYATIAPAVRDALRRGRLTKEAGLFAAAVLPVVLMVIVVRLAGAGWIGSATVSVALFGPSLVGQLVWFRAERRETGAVGAARRTLAKHKGVREGDPQLVPSWQHAFERVRRGQALGTGPATRPAAGRLAAWAFAVLMMATVLVLAPVSLVGVFGPVIWQVTQPKFGATEDKSIVANAVREFAAPVDSAITPIEAGQAYYSLLDVGGILEPSAHLREHPIPVEFPEPYFARELPDELFIRVVDGLSSEASLTRDPSAQNAPNHLNILEYAAGGLTPAETRYLEHLATLPQWEAWSTMARAPAMDYIGARFVVPFPDTVNYLQLPLPKFSATKAAAYASVSRAAYFLAEGRLDEAELALRETLGVGFKLVDQLTLFESLIGTVIVGIGREALIRFYTITDRPEATLLRSRVETARASVESAEATRAAVDIEDMRSLRRAMVTIVTTEGRLRGLSVELLSVLSFAPCTNVQELLLGPREDITRAIERARPLVARFESEEHFLNMVVETTDRAVGTLPSGAISLRTIRALGRLSGFVLGNPRIAGCTAWVTGMV